MKQLFICVLAFSSFCFAQTAQEIKKVIDDTKNAGTKDLPVSPKAQKNLDDAVRSPNPSTGPIPDNVEFSLDCKTWKNINLLSNSSSTKETPPKSFFLKKPSGEIGWMNESTRTLLELGGSSVAFYKVEAQAAIGLFGERGLMYRPLSKDKLYPGFVGMMQAMAIAGSELLDQWTIMISTDHLPHLLLMIDQPKRPILSKFHALSCISGKPCLLVANSNVVPRTRDLTVGSAEHQELKKIGAFDAAKFASFSELCDKITSSEFEQSFSSGLKAISTTCKTEVPKDRPSFQTYLDACNSWRKTLLPELSKFR